MIPKDGYHGEYLKDVVAGCLADNKQISDAVNALRVERGLPPRDYVAVRAAKKAKREAKGKAWWGGGDDVD